MTAVGRYRSANDLLKELGITEPKEIDIEAIAQHCAATITYQRLSGCEARIVGASHQAIITVNPSGNRGRERFSAAHELAHWLRDSGVAFCNPEAAFDDSAGANVETRANEYAADLLLPRFMFGPASKDRSMTIETASGLATLFETSLTATAIRLVRYGSFPAVLLWSESGRVKWFRRGPDVPESLWPRDPGRKTFAYDIAKSKGNAGQGDVYVDEWFTGAVERHNVHEDSARVTTDAVLSILWWKDERPLEEIVARDEQRVYRRSDWRNDD
jgi:hypothetical protein